MGELARNSSQPKQLKSDNTPRAGLLLGMLLWTQRTPVGGGEAHPIWLPRPKLAMRATLGRWLAEGAADVIGLFWSGSYGAGLLSMLLLRRVAPLGVRGRPVSFPPSTDLCPGGGLSLGLAHCFGNTTGVRLGARGGATHSFPRTRPGLALRSGVAGSVSTWGTAPPGGMTLADQR